LFSNVDCLLLPVFYNSFFACQTFHWPLGITIACHCNDLFSIPASFRSGNDAMASLPNNNINKGRWTHTRYLCKNMRSMAIIAYKLQKFSAHEHPLKLKNMLHVSSNKI
jgi:hypothetical protein